MSTPEGAVKSAIKKAIAKFGTDIWYHMPIGGAYSTKGVPDFCLVINGKAVFIETKAPGKKPTALQALCHDKIRQAGGKIFVIDSVESAERFEDTLRWML